MSELVISSEFAKKNKFKKKKLERLIYMRNVDGTFNHKVEFYRGHKEKIERDMI